MKIYILSIFFALSGLGVYAQIGINNPTPHASSVLDMSGDSNTTRGVLFPSTSDKDLMVSPRQNGLIVFDEVDNSFYYWKTAASTWNEATPWEAPDNEDYVAIDKKVGIGVTEPTTMFEVNGDALINGNTTTDTLKANAIQIAGFSENAMVPTGIIAMWSGTTAPDGWALCDGTYGTPDLRGRFIIGYKPMSEYAVIGKTGGTERVTLTVNNLPAHQHEANGNGATINIAKSGSHTHTFDVFGSAQDGDRPKNAKSNDGKSYTTGFGGNHTHDNSTFQGDVGDGSSHGLNAASVENRPPFYTLAYIIKL